ncbi:3-oxoacyl-[acyl-carrier-protein] synthase III C-terminal domain-containing protein [Nocardia sp. NPDC051756]|uniref:3-oxoacyl-ACP synthase III family protein n=1 Tax=Nocardia sp. NPDC051756 TaxID=3154751 RepID=UPI00341B5B71
MPRTRFESIGRYTPETVLSTEELFSRLKVEGLPRLREFSGVERRRVYDAHPDRYESSFELASRATADCLTKSDYAADELDVVISASISRSVGPGIHYLAPSLALRLGTAIGATRARCFDVANACAGMMTGILLLDRMIKAGVVRNGLVVSGEQITPVAETAVREIRSMSSNQFASLSIGDAGAAVVVDGRGDDGDEIHYVELMTLAEGAEHCLGMPSDRTGEAALYTDSQAMQDPAVLFQALHRFGTFLEETGRDFAAEEFDYVIYHQASDKVIEYGQQMVEQYFGAQAPPSLDVLREFGNTASTSHFVALSEHLVQRNIPRGSKILLIPQASGRVTGYLSATVSRLAA